MKSYSPLVLLAPKSKIPGSCIKDLVTKQVLLVFFVFVFYTVMTLSYIFLVPSWFLNCRPLRRC